MSLTSTNFKTVYTGNGSSTSFATGFYFLQNSDVSVVLTTAGVDTTLVQGTDYTISGSLIPTGGTVVLNVAPASGVTVSVVRTVPLTQNTVYVNNDAFPAASHEQALDKLTMIAQQQSSTGGATDRSIKYPATEPAGYISTLPASALRANKQLGFGINGALSLYQDLGQWRGYWVTGTAYNYRDLVQDPATYNIYTVVLAYTSGASIAADVTSGNLVLVISIAQIATAVLPFDSNQYGVASGTNTYTVSLTPTPTGYVTGMEIGVLIANSNTGASTINVNGLGAKTLQKNGAAFTGGEITANQTCAFRYDGTNFQIINPTVSVGTVTYPANTIVSNLTGSTASAVGNTLISTNNALNLPRVDVASGATTSIGGATSPYVRITGTTTITAFDTVGAGIQRTVLFQGALTLTYNSTSLILPTAANIITASGDLAVFISEGSGNWRCIDYQPANGQGLPISPVTLASAATVNLGGAASSYVKISGTTTITAFDNVPASTLRYVEFTGALTLTYNVTSLILPTAANINTATGDTANFISEGSGNWRCLSYNLASGSSLVSSSGGFNNRAVLTSGTSWTLPAGKTAFKATLIGGGGGGATANTAAIAGGGGSGAYQENNFSSQTPGTSYTYSIGSGGGAGSSGGSGGGTGGNTTFIVGATTYTAGGGSGGSQNTTGTGGNGGTNTNAIGLAIAGNTGRGGTTASPSSSSIGWGADTPLGYGKGAATPTATGGGISAVGYGAGGSAANGSSNNGGSGTNGIILIDY